MNPTDTVPSFLESAFGKQGSRSPRKISRGKPITSLTFDWNKEGYRRLFLSSFRSFKHSLNYSIWYLTFSFCKENKVLKAESVCNECVLGHTSSCIFSRRHANHQKREKLLKYYRKFKKSVNNIFKNVFSLKMYDDYNWSVPLSKKSDYEKGWVHLSREHTDGTCLSIIYWLHLLHFYKNFSIKKF